MESNTRSKAYPHYIADGLLLIYGLYGAFTGSLTIYSKHSSPLAIHGWPIWVACLFPIFSALGIFFIFDPEPRKALSEKQRMAFFILSMLAAIGALLIAFIYGA